MAGGNAEHGGEFTREQGKMKAIDYACGRSTVEEGTTVGELTKTASRIPFRDFAIFHRSILAPNHQKQLGARQHRKLQGKHGTSRA